MIALATPTRLAVHRSRKLIPEFRLHREPCGSGKRNHMTPPTGISPPYHRGSPIHQARRSRTGRNRCRRGARSPPGPSPSRRPKRNRRCPLLPTKPMPRLTPGRAPTRACWVDLMAAGLAEPRCASERGLAMGGGRPAERRFTVGGSSKSVARCHRSVLAYWKFESISLCYDCHVVGFWLSWGRPTW